MRRRCFGKGSSHFETMRMIILTPNKCELLSSAQHSILTSSELSEQTAFRIGICYESYKELYWIVLACNCNPKGELNR